MRCPNCRVETETTDFCSNCGAQLRRGAATEAPPALIGPVVPEVAVKPAPSRPVAPPPAPVAPPASARAPRPVAEPANNSGTGGPAPPEVLAMGYCWPGALFKTFWLSAHNIPVNWQTRIGAGGVFTSLGTAGWLGEHGYALAWQHRRFAGVREFQDTMKVWQTWAKAVPWIVGIIIGARILGQMVWVAINYPK